ncbi:interferon-inducible GTPase-domain-containing protein [Sparassis latifolia]
MAGVVVIAGAVQLYRMMNSGPPGSRRGERRSRQMTEVLIGETSTSRPAEHTTRSLPVQAEQHLIISTRDQVIRERLQYDDSMFNFAVTGNSGSGKSSLINAFRGLRNGQRGAARTSANCEGTSSAMRYSHPHYPQVWYDIPGAGTPNVLGGQYFRAQGLDVFDCIIVLIDMRLTETDIAILRDSAQSGIPTFIVRSKADQHIRNIQADMEESDHEDAMGRYLRAREACISETRICVQGGLHRADLPQQRVYLVSKDVLRELMSCISEVLAARGAKMDEQQRNFARLQRFDVIDEYALLSDLLERANEN